MSKIVVLGCGAVGKHMAIDLCRDPGLEVVCVDIKRENLEELASEHPIQVMVADLSKKEGITNAVKGADLVIGSVPYSLGYKMLESVIRAGKNIVDISYFFEDPFGLDDLAKKMGVTAVVDCGVAPGLSSIILGDHARNMKVSRFECYVGGIPKSKNVLYEYKSPFPVLEVLEEYAESGSRIQEGRMISEPMLAETKTIEFDGIGTLACLNSDGLRTLIQTMDIPEMFEKTLRYPGHVEMMRTFSETGFLDMIPIQVNRISIRPIDVTASLLSQHWLYRPGEADLTVMRLVISGEEDGKPVTYTYNMVDEYDPETGALSMARTTGYTCNAVARLVLDGGYTQKGIIPPEFLGRVKGCRGKIEKYLEDRNVIYKVQKS